MSLSRSFLFSVFGWVGWNRGISSERFYFRQIFFDIKKYLKYLTDQGCLEDGELLQLLNTNPGTGDEKDEEIEVQHDHDHDDVGDGVDDDDDEVNKEEDHAAHSG